MPSGATSRELPAPPDLWAFGRPLELCRLPLCPEIRVWLLAGDIDLEQSCRDLRDCQPPPYWAFCWGSGQALARFLLDHPHEVRERRVVDFGAGGGVVAIAAALAGARSVVAVDSDAAARCAVIANAAANGAELEVAERVPDAWDVLLASDVIYEGANRDWLLGLRAPGRCVIVSDPERPSSPPLPLPMQLLDRVEVRTLPDVDSPMRSAAVFRLVGRRDIG
jgi:predicted nicotinamide N-methyase